MFTELHVASAFSFLRGASLPETLIVRAAELGYPALALLDGCVRLFHTVHGARAAFQAEFLDPVPRAAIVGRMLANLRTIYAQSSDVFSLAWVARLRTRLPGADAACWRELGVVAGNRHVRVGHLSDLRVSDGDMFRFNRRLHFFKITRGGGLNWKGSSAWAVLGPIARVTRPMSMAPRVSVKCSDWASMS